MRQDQDYHRFADGRTLLGIQNAADVLSSLPFILVGAMGLAWLWRSRSQLHSYWLMFGAVALTGLGSVYYHLAPDDARMVWDRLPIAIAFMALLSAVISERVSTRAGTVLLLPLAIIGASSVFYWAAFDDLLPYALVQFGAIAAIVALCLRFPSRYTRGSDIFVAVAIYALAKASEMLDARVYALGGIVSGHTLKHLIAALAVWWLVRMLQLRSAST
jgi:hypothetical protein